VRQPFRRKASAAKRLFLTVAMAFLAVNSRPAF